MTMSKDKTSTFDLDDSSSENLSSLNNNLVNSEVKNPPNKPNLKNHRNYTAPVFFDQSNDSNRFLRPNNLNNDNNTTVIHSLNLRQRGNQRPSTLDLYRLKLSKSKLKAVTRTSALLSGFAMVAMVELNIDYGTYFDSFKVADAQKKDLLNKMHNSTQRLNGTGFSNRTTTFRTTTIDNSLENPQESFLIPESILIIYSLVTCLLVGVHMLALMISTCILPQVEATSEQMEFEQQLHKYDSSFYNRGASPNSRPNQNLEDVNKMASPGISEAHGISRMHMGNTYNDLEMIIYPHQKFHRFIELTWISSTVLGIFLFLVEIGLVCYIKFYPISILAAMAGTAVMTPILIMFILFTYTFYKKLADYKLNVTKQFFNQVDRTLLPLHEHIV